MMENNIAKISVVTVVFNNPQGLERTIKSVLEQTYKNIEFIIIDGGSNKDTIDIIKKYQSNITYWVSEPDKGIYDAMNKGIKAATGKWVNFMNSGDSFYSSESIAKTFANAINNKTALIYGYKYVNDRPAFTLNIKLLEKGIIIACHQSMFFNKELLGEELFYNTKYPIYADYELVNRIYLKYPNSLQEINLPIANYEGGGISSKPSWQKRIDKYSIIYKSYGFIKLIESFIYRLFIDDVNKNNDLQPLKTQSTSTLAPIILFVYKRADLTKQAVAALQKNHLAAQSELFIFSDAAKSSKDQKQVDEVREYINSIDSGFKNINITLRESNHGCANSVISGVSEIINKYGKVIVLEDDLITSANFLDYMNQALEFYKDKKVFSICGFSFAINFPDNKSDIYFIPRAGSWGWASWKDKWENIDWNISDYQQFKKDKKARKKFNQGGADMAQMLDKQMANKIDSWAIRWGYAAFKLGLPTIYPRISKVQNIGFGTEATHSKYNSNYKIFMDDGSKRNFKFDDKIELNKSVIKQFRYSFSLISKVKNRLINYIRKIV